MVNRELSRKTESWRPYHEKLRDSCVREGTAGARHLLRYQKLPDDLGHVVFECVVLVNLESKFSFFSPTIEAAPLRIFPILMISQSLHHKQFSIFYAGPEYR